jgi:hypothetical protein
VIYWPGINTDIENLIKKCKVCVNNSMSNPREPLYPHEIPNHPWQKLGCDLFQYGAKEYTAV